MLHLLPHYFIHFYIPIYSCISSLTPALPHLTFTLALLHLLIDALVSPRIALVTRARANSTRALTCVRLHARAPCTLQAQACKPNLPHSNFDNKS